MTTPTREIIQAAIDKWTPAAVQADEASFAVPIRVLAGEAIDLAHFMDRYWEPQVIDKRPIPGLKQTAANGLLRKEMSEELVELQLAMSDQYARYLMLVSSKLEAPVERGEFVLSELRQTLAFVFDDGVSDEQDVQLSQYDEVHAKPATHDALALALEAYAHFADKHRDRMKGLPEFEPGVIDEALDLARRLREQSALRLTQAESDAQRAAIRLRNQLATLLIERMNTIRNAARYVFRNHPEIARKATSSFERDRRARARRRAESETAETETGAVAQTA